LSCCGEEGASPASTPPLATSEEPVDPQGPTVEAVLQEHNRLTANKLVDLFNYIPLMKMETPEQEREFEWLGLLSPLLAMEQAAWDRFGASIIPEMVPAPPLRVFIDEATLVEQESTRARAEQGAADGSVKSIYFVKTNGRWWVSGYTLHYNPNLFEHHGYMREAPEDAIRLGNAATQLITREIESGKYATAAEARKAFYEEMARIESGNRSGGGYIPFGQ
jgi:hypothetical protein